MKKSLILLLMVVFIPQLSLSAQTSTTCPAAAQTILQQLGDNCGGLGQNQICYGSVALTAAFDPARSDFTTPGSRAGNRELIAVEGSVFSTSASEWGISLLNVQANLPLSLPGLVLIGLGDTRLENGVSPDDALLLPANPQTITVVGDGGTVYDVPPGFGSEPQTVGSLIGGTVLEADAIDPSGQWVRVEFLHDRLTAQRATAWVSISSINETINPATLPVITPTSQTPMQAFYLTNGFENPECLEVPPSMLYVQGPQAIEADFIVNGAPIRLSSTMLLRVLPPGDAMQVISLSGLVALNPGTPDEILLPPGFTSSICLLPPQNLGLDNQPNDPFVGDCGWSPPALLSAADLTALFLAFDGRIPQNVQYYRTSVPQLVCPSGIGSAQCTLLLDDENLLARLARICSAGLLDDSICRVLGVSG